MSIKNKLVYGFGLILFFILVIAFFNRSTVNNIENSFNNISKVSVPSVEHISSSILYLERSSSFLKTHLLSKSVDNKTIEAVHANLKNSLDSLVKLQSIYPSNKSIGEAIELVKQFSITINETIETQNQKINLINGVYETEAQEARAQRTLKMIEESQIINYNINLDTLNNIFNKLLVLENNIKKESIESSDNIIKAINNSTLVNIILTLTVLGAACVISYLIIKSIAKSLNLFQKGLDGFFDFLNKESKKAHLIDMNDNSENRKNVQSVLMIILLE